MAKQLVSSGTILLLFLILFWSTCAICQRISNSYGEPSYGNFINYNRQPAQTSYFYQNHLNRLPFSGISGQPQYHQPTSPTQRPLQYAAPTVVQSPSTTTTESPKTEDTDVRTEEVEVTMPNGEKRKGIKKITTKKTSWNTTTHYISSKSGGLQEMLKENTKDETHWTVDVPPSIVTTIHSSDPTQVSAAPVQQIQQQVVVPAAPNIVATTPSPPAPSAPNRLNYYRPSYEVEHVTRLPQVLSNAPPSRYEPPAPPEQQHYHGVQPSASTGYEPTATKPPNYSAHVRPSYSPPAPVAPAYSTAPVYSSAPVTPTTYYSSTVAPPTYYSRPATHYSPAPVVAPAYSPAPVVAPTYSPAPVVAPTYSPAPVAAPTYSPAPVVAPAYSQTPVAAPAYSPPARPSYSPAAPVTPAYSVAPAPPSYASPPAPAPAVFSQLPPPPPEHEAPSPTPPVTLRPARPNYYQMITSPPTTLRPSLQPGWLKPTSPPKSVPAPSPFTTDYEDHEEPLVYSRPASQQIIEVQDETDHHHDDDDIFEAYDEPTAPPPTTTTTTSTTKRPHRPRPRPAASTYRPQARPSSRPSSSSDKNQDQDYKFCPALLYHSPGVRIECSHRNRGVRMTTCSEPQPVGTEAKYTCKDYYESSTGRVVMYRQCKPDGTWTGNSDRFSCILECGRANFIKSPLITNGMPALKSQWPWNIALFLNRDFICGGTLITESAVLTAAHCVTYSESTEVRSETEFRLEFGKHGLNQIDEFVQARQVRRIIVHESYSPYGFDSDIAIIVLSSAIEVGYHVRPICYPQSTDSSIEELHLSDGTLGTVVGWGNTEAGQLADTLQMVRLPVVGHRQCLESMQDAYAVRLQTRSTTYCAGFGNATNVCNGDSGAGMYFPTQTLDSIRWYIEGLVSVGIPDENRRCDPTKYSVFTRIGRYADWINKVLSEEDAT